MTASIFDTMADAHNTGVLVVVSDTEDEGAAEAAREAARARWREEFRRRLAEQQARSGASGRNEARVHDVLRAADQQVGGYRAQRLRRLWDLVREELPSHENLPLGIRWNVATRVWGQAGWQVEIACSHDSGIAGIAWTNVGLEALGVGVVSEANFLAAGRQVAWEEAQRAREWLDPPTETETDTSDSIEDNEDDIHGGNGDIGGTGGIILPIRE